MRIATMLGLGLLLVAVVGLSAADDKAKPVTLTGKITCAKCELGITPTCATVIQVKEEGKDVVYFFDAKSNKQYHKEICVSAKPGSVTGVVSEADGKKTITVSKVKFGK
ncbi:MAG: DUF6370 family protein [Gemmataceae bacterium]